MSRDPRAGGRLDGQVWLNYDGRWCGRICARLGKVESRHDWTGFRFFDTPGDAWAWVADVGGRSLGDLVEVDEQQGTLL